jgi:hypothetical protein
MKIPACRAGLWAGLAVVGAGGCTNARDEFVDFGDRVVDASNIDIDGAIVSELPNVDGMFFMVARPDLPEDRFLRFTITYDYTPITANTGVMDYIGICHDVDTNEPTGDPPIEAFDFEVRNDATYDAPLVGTFDGDCNAIVPGATVEADGVVHGSLRTDDFLCGTMSGTAGGLSLVGTTWAAQRITGDTLPDPIWRCEDQPSL